jgi:hypothetical protein
MDDLDHAALACDVTTPPRGDVQELLILRGGEGPRRGQASKDAIGFGHVAPDETGVAKRRRWRRQNLGIEQYAAVSVPDLNRSMSWPDLQLQGAGKPRREEASAATEHQVREAAEQERLVGPEGKSRR